MSVEDHKAIARRVDEELFNRGNLSVADAFFAVSFVYHAPTTAAAGDVMPVAPLGTGGWSQTGRYMRQ